MVSASTSDPLHLVEAEFLVPSVVELRRAGGGMVRYLHRLRRHGVITRPAMDRHFLRAAPPLNPPCLTGDRLRPRGRSGCNMTFNKWWASHDRRFDIAYCTVLRNNALALEGEVGVISGCRDKPE